MIFAQKMAILATFGNIGKYRENAVFTPIAHIRCAVTSRKNENREKFFFFIFLICISILTTKIRYIAIGKKKIMAKNH